MAMILGMLGRGFGKLGAAGKGKFSAGTVDAPDNATSGNEYLIFFI